MIDTQSLRTQLLTKALNYARRFIREPGHIMDPVALAASMEVFVQAEGESQIQTRIGFLEMAIERGASFYLTRRSPPDLIMTAEAIATFVRTGVILEEDRRSANAS